MTTGHKVLDSVMNTIIVKFMNYKLQSYPTKNFSEEASDTRF